MNLRICRYKLRISQCDIAALAFLLLFLADSVLTLGLLNIGYIEEAGWLSAFLLKNGGSSAFFFGRIAFAVSLLLVLEVGLRVEKITEKGCIFWYTLAFLAYLAAYIIGVLWVNNFFRG